MHAVIRNYSGSGAKELFDLLEARKSDVDDLMRSIEGFDSYLLLRTADGGASITICQDRTGTEESLRRAREWIATNASSIQASPPTVSEGPVIVQLNAREARAENRTAVPLSQE